MEVTKESWTRLIFLCKLDSLIGLENLAEEKCATVCTSKAARSFKVLSFVCFFARSLSRFWRLTFNKGAAYFQSIVISTQQACRHWLSLYNDYIQAISCNFSVYLSDTRRRTKWSMAILRSGRYAFHRVTSLQSLYSIICIISKMLVIDESSVVRSNVGFKIFHRYDSLVSF